MTESERSRQVLKKHGVPKPPTGVISNLRYVARTGDWYVLVDDTWYYSEQGKKPWKPTPMGPP